MVRRIVLALALAGLAGASIVPVASASPAARDSFSGSYLLHAGEMCDFEYLQEYSTVDLITTLSDGRVQIHEKLTVTHTNLDTGYALTETDQTNYLFMPDGTPFQAAIYWHLRDPEGKLVVLQAGLVVYDADYNVVKVTGNLAGSFSGVMCPALGGAPA